MTEVGRVAQHDVHVSRACGIEFLHCTRLRGGAAHHANYVHAAVEHGRIIRTFYDAAAVDFLQTLGHITQVGWRHFFHLAGRTIVLEAAQLHVHFACIHREVGLEEFAHAVALGSDDLVGLVNGEVKLCNNLSVLPGLANGVVVSKRLLPGQEVNHDGSGCQRQCNAK